MAAPRTRTPGTDRRPGSTRPAGRGGLQEAAGVCHRSIRSGSTWWLTGSTRDNQPQTQGAEDSAYLGQNPPYLAANQYITSTTELLALPGFGRENYAETRALHCGTAPQLHLNVCTAKGQVLDAFNPELHRVGRRGSTAEKPASAAPGCFPDMPTTHATFGSPDRAPAPDQSLYVRRPAYFRLSSLITIGSAEFNLYSLLYLDNQYFVHPIQRSFSPD